MKKTTTAKDAPPVSDQAVQAKTGKNWKQWFAILDKAGAKKMTHKEIAAHIYENLGCPGWWSQMVAVGYERARGLREKHQTASGYQISCSKTVAVSLRELFAAWHDEKKRDQWLKEKGLVVRKATAAKSMRVTWVDGKTNVEVGFFAKGEGKSQVAVEHNKLPHASAVKRMKAYWQEKLDRLREFLED